MKRSLPTLTESIISLAILGLLGVIATGIYIKQFHFNPAVQAIEQIQTKTGPSVSPKTDISTLLKLTHQVSVLSPAQFFDKRSLSDKIDGKAEFYLAAGFTSLKTQRYKINAVPQIWFEAYIYEMENPEAAFAVFSGQKRENAKPLEITPNAYETQNAIYLTHGRFYFEMIASNPSPKLLDLMVDLSGQFVKDTPIRQTTSKTDPKSWFATSHMVEGSFALLSKDAFGFQGFNKVYIAKYQFENTVLTGFVLSCNSKTDAQHLGTQYKDMLLSFGGNVLDSDKGSPFNADIEILGLYELIFTNRHFLAGVHEATDLKSARQLAQLMKNHLQQLDP